MRQRGVPFGTPKQLGTFLPDHMGYIFAIFTDAHFFGPVVGLAPPLRMGLGSPVAISRAQPKAASNVLAVAVTR
jgi:hypothetical protein